MDLNRRRIMLVIRLRGKKERNNLKNLKVGMTVYVRPTGSNNTRYIKGNTLDYVKETKISKIGRKYFYLEGYNEKFSLDTLEYDSEHHFDLKAYLDKQDIEDEIEIDKLETKIRNKFRQFGNFGLTLNQLREISQIIFKEET